MAAAEPLPGKAAARPGGALLGPVIHRWLLGLHQYVNYFDDGETAFLFCARAGLRIRELYGLFLAGLPHRPALPGEMFWISRVSVCKGTFAANRTAASGLISREYLHMPISKAIEGLLRHQPDLLAGLDLARPEHRAHADVFDGWLDGATPEARVVRRYLEECSAAFGGYVGERLAGRKRAVLIDSGWQGSVQGLLAGAFPEVDWQGIYFGRILGPWHGRDIAGKVIGLMFENDSYTPSVPESSFVLHRHLIESLLEPNGRSIEEIPAGKFNAAAAPLIASNETSAPDPDLDRLYLEVCDYLRANAGLGLAAIHARHHVAMAELARILVHPGRDEALAFKGKDRSADFGKHLAVPVLIAPDSPSFPDSDGRIVNSLWPQGQIALEYAGGVARELQLRASGVADASGYFDPAAANTGQKAAAGRHPVVAVITRTKDRPLLLRRAAQSVEQQRYGSYLWVVVNDGGSEDEVRQVIARSAIDRRKIRLVSNAESAGMEAASNLGIRSVASDYVLIHDDDDSLHPDYLAKAVAFLESPAGRRYGGAITRTVYVSEEIRGGTVIEHDRYPYQDWVRNVQIAEMACNNFFPPIAFLYRRSLWEKVGGYNEALPVLGDWYFNLEFLLEADIAVIPEPLAYYHHRDRGAAPGAGLYANSVIGGRSKHEEFAAVLRNQFIRKHASRNPAALAVILGYMTNEVRNQGDRLKREISSNGNHTLTAMPAGESARPVPEGASAISRQALERLLDLADRQFLVADFNGRMAARSAGLFAKAKPVPPLSPDAPWSGIAASFGMAGIAMPVPATFDDQQYLATNADVAAAVRNGSFASGFEHFVKFGRNEGRARPPQLPPG